MKDELVLPEDLDLNEIFIGRERQLNDFHAYLEKWLRSVSISSPPPLTMPPAPNNRIQGLFVLLHGRGGFGKSTLLQHYRQIALEYRHELLASKTVDWEFMAQDRRALFNITDRENIDANQYFNLLYRRLASALDKQRREFSDYQAAEKLVDRARKQAYEVLDQLQHDDRFDWLQGLGIARDILLALALADPKTPEAISILVSNDALLEKFRETFDTWAGEGIEQLQRLHRHLQERLGRDLSDYLDTPLQLGLALGKDLARFAERHPLLIFFDTYEEIDEGDKLLQVCMGAAGARVGWVISGRDNLWAGKTQRARSQDAESGYRELVYPSHSMAVDFSADGVGDFTLSDIREYFKVLCQKTNLPLPPEESFKNVLAVTHGVPLAVKIVATLYLERSDLALITARIDDRREIVDQMVERYLVHTRSNPSDRMRLYGLAVLRRVEDPAITATALDVTQEQAASELSRLHRRYGFIFTASGQPAMHSEVRYFLRLWLLQARARPEIMALIKRLRDALAEEFKAREKQYRGANLRRRLEDREWRKWYLDLAELEFWVDPDKGVKFLLPFMCAASIYQREANREARMLGNFFEEVVNDPYRMRWKWADRCFEFVTNRNPLRDEFTGLRALVRLADEEGISFSSPVPNYREELEAALWWRLAEAYSTSDIREAVSWYEKARRHLPRDSELNKAYEDAVQGRDALASSPRTVSYYLQLARECALNNEPQRAIEYCNDALALDKKNIQAYIERGSAYLLLNEASQAITSFDHVLFLDPDNVVTLRKRGEVYALLKDFTHAIADFDKASKLDPDNKISREKLQELRKKLKEQKDRWKVPERRQGKRGLSWPLAVGIVVVALLLLGAGTFAIITSQRTPRTQAGRLKLLYASDTHKDTVQGVAWSPDGRYIASASYDSSVHILDAENGQLLVSCIGHTGNIWRVAWSPDSRYVVSGGDDATVRVWDVENGKQIFKGMQGSPIRGIAWSQNNRYIASSDHAGNIKIWDVSHLDHVVEAMKIDAHHPDGSYGLAWSHDSQYLAVGNENGTVDVWDVVAQKLISAYKNHTTSVYYVAWSPDDRYIASASSDNTLQVWEVGTGTKRFKPRTDFLDSVYGVAWSPDGKYIAASSKDGSLHVYDATDGRIVALYVGTRSASMTGVAWSPDSKRIVTGNFDHRVRVWQFT